ncbi:hypothetical protein NQ317_012379 [Molorchus minor]|uniref:Uncharacterized protein n=1 Tax=Molorchus minor TaxID=1323400 RepID=A0ABQ9ITX4_9CUCU|nr:hypothetical protein NQ317_012379 [Molorchus minor]
MAKRIFTILVVILSAMSFCEAQCPLNTIDGEISPSNNITQMIGRWLEHKKTTDFLTNETCIMYDISCSNETMCKVDLLHKEAETIKTITLAKKWNQHQVGR